MSSTNYETINQSYIGSLIAQGGDFVVYHYGDSQVIKYSQFSLIFGRRLHHKIVHDYTICKTYLDTYIVDSTTITGSRQYIELQPYIHGSPLAKSDLTDPIIRKQFDDICQGVHNMEQDGYDPIDLIGLPGTIQQCFSNIIVDENRNLRIIDATLFESKSVGLIGYLVEPVMWIAQWVQQRKINKWIYK